VGAVYKNPKIILGFALQILVRRGDLMENFLSLFLTVVCLVILGSFFTYYCLKSLKQAENESNAIVNRILDEARQELYIKLNDLKSEIRAVNTQSAASYRSGV
jgi:uncharacterized membrane protein